MDERLKDKLKIGAIALFFLALTYLIFTNSSLVNRLATGYGLVGVFIASIIANATVLLPLPIDLLVIVINAQSDSLAAVVILSAVVGIGAAIGELSAYFAGLLGVETAERFREKEFTQIKEVREKLEAKGMVFVFLMAMVPFPFDIIGITAGFIRYNLRNFFIAALFGKTIRYIALGVAAYYGFAAIKGFI